MSSAIFTDNNETFYYSNNFEARPYIQTQGEFVNITYAAISYTNIEQVQVVVSYPNNISKTEDMKLKDGKYIYNRIYDVIGCYNYFIIIENESGIRTETTNKSFWITKNVNDTDNDGMPDWWEEKHSFDRFDPNDAEKDTDGDGCTNVKEYNEGTSPLKKSSMIENILYKIKKNYGYFIVSILLFTAVIVLSMYGLSRRK